MCVVCVAVKWFFKWLRWQHEWELVRWDHALLTRGMALREDKRGHGLSFISVSSCKIVRLWEKRGLDHDPLLTLLHSYFFERFWRWPFSCDQISALNRKRSICLFLQNFLLQWILKQQFHFKMGILDFFPRCLNSTTLCECIWLSALGKPFLSHFFFLYY